jgi:L-ascorbate metabolism protein UlaG (beta-lactamase superfamily)
MLDLKGNRITYFGHSAFSLTSASGQVALIDPWIMSNPRCPDSLKKLARADVIFLSHGHGDHFGDVLAIAQQFHPKLVAIYETCCWLAEQGFEKEVLPMSKGGAQQVGDFGATMTHAMHSNSIEPGGATVYHAGDTALFGDMKLIGELYQPQLAMLPIGDLFTMGPREAAYAIRFLNVKHVIPMHYATFPVLTGTPDKLRQETRDIAGLEIHALQPGEAL